MSTKPKALRGRGLRGARGLFRLVRHDTKAARERILEEEGKLRPVQFHDLWQMGPDGQYIPKDPKDVVQDVEAKNKILRRGLGYFLRWIFNQKSGYTTDVYPPELVGSLTTDVFSAFILLSDQTSPPFEGDARVTWDEGDTTNNAKIPNSSSVAGEGRRGVTTATTTGTGLKRVGVRLTDSNPITEFEYIFFAEDNPVGAPYETGDQGIDNFPIMACGMANGTACGDGEANSIWGIRAVLGLAPTFQGVCDRDYQHEGTGLTLYTGTTILTVDGYVESGHTDGYSGDYCFDGYVQQEGLDGYVELGDKWVSVDSGGPHHVGRLWNISSPKTIAGIRITMPAGTPKANVPNRFKIRYLDASANGGNPRPAQDTDWTDVSGEDYTSTDQGDYIFEAGVYGYEYVFATPVTNCVGIKISSLTAVDNAQKVEVGEMYIFSEMSAVTLTAGVDDVLRLATDGAPTFAEYALGDVGPTQDVQDLVDAINRQVYGWEMEAVRSEFGYLWFRSTVAGDNSLLDMDSEANGSTANTTLGFHAAATQLQGETETVTKGTTEALTIIYRIKLDSDTP